jgi:hypothetical protein
MSKFEIRSAKFENPLPPGTANSAACHPEHCYAGAPAVTHRMTRERPQISHPERAEVGVADRSESKDLLVYSYQSLLPDCDGWGDPSTPTARLRRPVLAQDDSCCVIGSERRPAGPERVEGSPQLDDGSGLWPRPGRMGGGGPAIGHPLTALSREQGRGLGGAANRRNNLNQGAFRRRFFVARHSELSAGLLRMTTLGGVTPCGRG